MIDYKSKWAFFLYFIFSIFIGASLGIFLIYYFIGLDEKTVDNLKVFSYLFIAFAALIATAQLGINAKQAKKNAAQVKYSNDWNKKQLATIRLHKSDKVIKKTIANLHSTLDVVGRDIDNPYQPYEIHNKMGVFLQNGEFIYHGEETKEHIEILPKKSLQKKNHINEFSKNIKGRKVRDNIIALLNEYEYISLNVNQDIFDRKSVVLLYDMKILRTYKKFKKYIEHLRGYHNFGNDVYIEFEKLANDIIKTKDSKDIINT